MNNEKTACNNWEKIGYLKAMKEVIEMLKDFGMLKKKLEELLNINLNEEEEKTKEMGE